MMRFFICSLLYISALYCADSEESVLQLKPAAIAYFNASLTFYEGVIKSKKLSEVSGLSGIFHAMFIAGAKQVSQDSEAQVLAGAILKGMQNDPTIQLLLNARRNAATCISEERAKKFKDQVLVLAQKDSVLGMSQLGFQVAVPEGDLNDIFSQALNVERAESLFVRNAEFPNTPEAVATIRGGSIANCYFAQENDLLVPGAVATLEFPL